MYVSQKEAEISYYESLTGLVAALTKMSTIESALSVFERFFDFYVLVPAKQPRYESFHTGSAYGSTRLAISLGKNTGLLMAIIAQTVSANLHTMKRS